MMDGTFIDSCQSDAQWEATLPTSGLGTVCEQSCMCPQTVVTSGISFTLCLTISCEVGTYLKIASVQIRISPTLNDY
jgi:hypothetical protein